MAKARAAHMPGEPKGFIILRIAQLVFAIVVLALAAYSQHYWTHYLAGSGPGMSIFTALVTIFFVIYLFVSTFGPQSLYNYWAVLALDLFLVIFWLISFALCAARVALLAAYGVNSCVIINYYGDEVCSNNSGGFGAFGAAAGLGALMFLLFIVSLAFTTIYMLRHRSSGGHSGAGAAHGTAGPNDLGESKIEMQPQPQVYPNQTIPPQQQPYTGQPQQQPYTGQPQQQYTAPPQTTQPQQYQPQYDAAAQQHQPGPIQQQPTGTTEVGGYTSPSPAPQQYQQPTHYAQPAQYENGPQQLDTRAP